LQPSPDRLEASSAQLPAVFYKYRPVNERTKNLLSRRELYFPLAAEINDPFDCRIILNRDAPPETLWPMLKAHLQKKYATADEVEVVYRLLMDTAPKGYNVTRERAEKFVADEEWRKMPTHTEIGYMNILSARLAKTRLLCMSAVPDSLLMWSHYSDSHQGICLGFAPDPVLSKMKPVTYVRDYPDVSSYLVDDEAYVNLSLYTKSIDWKYEKEWRLVLTAADRITNPIYRFPSGTLSEVVFGCQCSFKDRLRVETWIGAAGLDPKMYEAVPARGAFRLQVKLLT
jgi:hypothetical protein